MKGEIFFPLNDGLIWRYWTGSSSEFCGRYKTVKLSSVTVYAREVNHSEHAREPRTQSGYILREEQLLVIPFSREPSDPLWPAPF